VFPSNECIYQHPAINAQLQRLLKLCMIHYLGAGVGAVCSVYAGIWATSTWPSCVLTSKPSSSVSATPPTKRPQQQRRRQRSWRYTGGPTTCNPPEGQKHDGLMCYAVVWLHVVAEKMSASPALYPASSTAFAADCTGARPYSLKVSESIHCILASPSTNRPLPSISLDASPPAHGLRC